METIQLTDSLVQSFGGDSVTLFIGRQNGRYGVVAAGSWEVVLPFCFRRVEAGEGGTITALLGRRWIVYQVVRTGERLEARVQSTLARREKKLLSLPA